MVILLRSLNMTCLTLIQNTRTDDVSATSCFSVFITGVEAELSQARLSEEDEKVSKRQRRYLSSGEYQISDILNHFWLTFLFQD